MSPEQMNRLVALNNALTMFALAAPLLAALLAWAIARRRGVPGLPLAFGGAVAHMAGLYLTGWLFRAAHDDMAASFTTVNRAYRAGQISTNDWVRGATLANHALVASLAGGLCTAVALALVVRRVRPLERAAPPAAEPAKDAQPAPTPPDGEP